MNHNWSNLVGKSGQDAKQHILKDMPDAQVQVLPEGSPVTRDLRMNRVRVFVDAHQKVVSAPHPG